MPRQLAQARGLPGRGFEDQLRVVTGLGDGTEALLGGEEEQGLRVLLSPLEGGDLGPLRRAVGLGNIVGDA